MVPTIEPAVQQQRAGEGHVQQTTDPAQQTPTIGHADDGDMPPVLPCTKFPRHNEELEADAANCQSVRKKCPTNANLRHAVNSSHQANHVQQWSGRDSQLFHVHAKCITEWCWHRHRHYCMFPRQCSAGSCRHRHGALDRRGHEVPTTASKDEDLVFHREEALRFGTLLT